ncbi:MAG: hypothetical protein PHP14_02275, partial [Candidatus Pacebacteria bacterium]|nr:hypothetical protein [Candidatus Paceibacterota bacterium]
LLFLLQVKVGQCRNIVRHLGYFSFALAQCFFNIFIKIYVNYTKLKIKCQIKILFFKDISDSIN